MANSTLLQLVDMAYAEMALGTVPATVIANTALDAVNLLNLVNAIGNDLVREHPWQALDKEYRFTTVFYTYTATTTLDSVNLSVLSSSTGLTTSPTYFAVTGAGIPSDTMLVSVNAGAATAVLSRAATATGTLVSLNFCQVFYDMPTDYDRLIDNTQWDKSNRWQLIGPASAQGWQWLKSGQIATGPRTQFRVLADKFQIYPPIASARYFGFEYLSRYWVFVTAATATTKSSFTVDTDTCIFNDRLMVEALQLRFRRNGSLPMTQYSPSEIQRGYPLATLNVCKTADAGSPTLSMGSSRYGHLISESNIPDGNWTL